MIEIKKITDRIYEADTTKEEIIKILLVVHSRLIDTYYESAPQRKEQRALDALEEATIQIRESSLN